MTETPPMKPSSEERLVTAIPRTAYPMILEDVVTTAYRDGFLACAAQLAEPSEELVEAIAIAFWTQCRSSEYDEITGIDAVENPSTTWTTEIEESREVARDISRTALRAVAAKLGET